VVPRVLNDASAQGLWLSLWVVLFLKKLMWGSRVQYATYGNIRQIEGIDRPGSIRYISRVDIVPQLIANSVIAGATYAIIALGFNLIYGTTKFFNLAHGVIAAAGAYAVLAVVGMSGISMGIWPGSIIGVLAAGALSMASNALVYAPLRKRKASSMVLMVASLGVFTVIQAVLAILFTSQFQSLSRGSVSGTFEFGGAIMTYTQSLIVLTSILVTAGVALIIRHTLFGKAVAAIQDDEEVARMVGIDTDRIVSRVFFIGSAIAGIAGILIGIDTGIEPTMGMNLLLKGTIASIVGGVGNIMGGFFGAFILGFAENFGIWKVSGEWKDAIAFVLLIIFLIFRPQGIFKK